MENKPFPIFAWAKNKQGPQTKAPPVKPTFSPNQILIKNNPSSQFTDRANCSLADTSGKQSIQIPPNIGRPSVFPKKTSRYCESFTSHGRSWLWIHRNAGSKFNSIFSRT